MKLLTALLWVLILGPTVTSDIFGQTYSDLGLVLRGRLSEGKATHQKGAVIWSGKLLMEFENTSNKPIILINPSLEFGTGLSKAEFYFSGTDRREGKYSEVKDALGFEKELKLSHSQSENFRSIAGLFDSERPPDNLTVVLAPHSTLSFIDKLEIKQKYSIEKKEDYVKTVVWEGMTDWYRDGRYQIGMALGDAGNFRLTYQFSLTPFTDSPDLLEKISFRWKKYGQIPMSQDGTYRIVSELITIRRDFEKTDWPEESRHWKLQFPFYTF